MRHRFYGTLRTGPWQHDRSEESNRLVRRNYLEACVRVANMKNPAAKDVVGIATESGLDNTNRSEDAMYFDASEWTDEEETRREPDDVVLPDYFDDAFSKLTARTGIACEFCSANCVIPRSKSF